MTPADLYSIHFQNPEPKFYSRVPHILDHLTYDEIDKKSGKKMRKRLSVFAIQLYRIIKSIAGDDGVCWKNTENLAEQANMSVGAVCNAKKELQNKFHQLDGNPLIVIIRKKKTRGVGGTTYDNIQVCDIWSWNNAFMATLKYHKNSSHSQNESEDTSHSPNEFEPPESDSPVETNKNPTNKNPLFKEEQPTAEPSVASLDKKNKLFPSEDSEKIYEYLLSQKCTEATAKRICKSISLDDFKNALDYTNRMCLKNPKHNKWGYLQSVIKNKWWKKTK